MAHLIDKDALVAEIKKLMGNPGLMEDWRYRVKMEEKNELLKSIINTINSLEVKEVDLEEALSDLDKDIKEFVTTEEFENESTTAGHYWVIAKHAFLLGLKAQKGEEV